MLKLQHTLNLIPKTRAKCGEIFCHSFKEFTIFCTFCQMKTFQFDDFLLHIQNVHLKSDLEKSLDTKAEKCSDVLQVSVKNETISHRKEGALMDNIGQSSLESLEKGFKNEDVLDERDSVLWDDVEKSLSSCSENDDTDSWEGEKLEVLKKIPKTKTRSKRKKDSQNVQLAAEVIKSELNKCLKDVGETLTKKSKIPEYTCTECHETFLQKKYLDQHVRDLHNGYKCAQCDKRFSRTSHVEYHLKTHTTEKKFICPMENCGRGFVDEDYLKRHLEVHTMERNFTCEYENCGKAFQTQRRLASHEYTHRIPKKFVCDMCGYSCRSNPQLITHQRVHTGEKPFPCEVCSKPFISKIALQEHMISHSEKRPHVCSICNRAFANRRVLVRHRYIHSDEKTFKCKLCESAFKHPNSLQGHMRHVHREPKLKST